FEADDGPEGWLDYNTDLFDDTTMARLERDWHDLLAAAVECPDAALSTLARLRPATRHQLLHEWNEPAWDWPRAGPGAPRRTTVVDLVTHWAGRSPDAVALEEPPGASGVSRQVTYRELTGRARRLARRLVAEGVGPDAPVAVAVPRSIDQVVALLAVLEAGGCYVPVDPSYPEPRRAFLVADAEVRAALVAGGADAEAVEVFRRAGVPVIDPAGAAGADEPEPVRSGPESGPDPESLAYVLYTSGSTGEPKGTAVPHRAVVRLVEGLDAYAPIGPADVLLALAPLAFDASTFELWGALGRGARLALSPEDRAGVRPESGSGSESGSGPGWGLEGLETALARHRVTVLWLTAGLFHLVADRRPAMLGGLRRLLSGGDVLSPAAVQAVLDELPELALVDGYGPTEATTFTCCHPVGPTGSTRSIPIGRPVPGTRVHVVDRSLRPTPPGVPGELSIGGAGLARGYRGRAAATAERFVPDPFGPSGSGAGSGVGSGEGARLYRSGDRVRWRPDGRLEFLGRLDRQVKVRGYRIEPGEVEAALEGHPAVEDAVVDLRSGRLVGYVVLRRSGTSGGHDHDPGALRGFLEGRLPEFMIPSLFVAVDALPLTANGKVDRAALPAPEEALAAAAGGEAPATAAEETLAGIWREVLGLERLGVHDRFFDLGGDSILAIQVISRAVEAGLPLQPRHLFEHPTVAGLAAVVGSGATAGSGAVVDEGPVSGAVPLGPAQRWLLEGLDPPVPDHWNMALLLEPRDGVVAGAERLRLDRLERAARALTLRHDMLRARFHRAPEGWRQEVEPAAPDDRPGVPGPVAAVDLRALPPEAEERSARAAVAALQGSLDLARGPLFRLVRFDRPGAPGRSRPRPRSRSRPRTQLLVLVHHLVADAVSLRVLLDDLHRSAGSASGRVAAPRRTASYRRWVDALAEWARDPERSAEERAFWRGVAGSGGEAPGGSAKERRETEARAGSVTAGVPPEVTRRLVTEVPETLRASLEELILAAVTAALDPERGPGGETGTAWVEMEGHGRRLPARSAGEALDLSRTVGWFTTQYPVRVRLPERRDGDDREGGASGPGSGVGRRVPRMLRAVKEALRAVPSGGVGYAALRWPDPVDPVDPADPADPADPLQAALAGLPRPALSFNFLGRLDEAFGDFRLVAGGAGPVRHPRAPRPHPLELVAFVLGDELHTVWTFSPSVHRRSEVEALAERTVAMLRRLARAAGEGEREGAAEALDASDFPHSDLGAGDLERLLDDLGEDG
ncbi:MAG: amino acid adenylation domain-containing protein, partial [Acidobacteriota bacterium]